MQVIPLLFLSIWAPAPQQVEITFVDFRLETFFPMKWEEFLGSKSFVSEGQFREIRSIVDRWSSQERPPELSEGRWRLGFRDQGKEYLVDGSGNINIVSKEASRGGRIPEPNLQHLNRMILRAVGQGKELDEQDQQAEKGKMPSGSSDFRVPLKHLKTVNRVWELHSINLPLAKRDINNYGVRVKQLPDSLYVSFYGITKSPNRLEYGQSTRLTFNRAYLVDNKTGKIRHAPVAN